MKRPKVEFKCKLCGSEQSKNEEESTPNWSVYDCKQKCVCGGDYVMHLDGKPMGGGENT